LILLVICATVPAASARSTGPRARAIQHTYSLDYDRATAEMEAAVKADARDIAAERGLALIPPYEHPHVIAGQGTAAQELFDEVGPLDLLLVPCGGGGLLSGSALSARALSPGCRVIGVEPEKGDDATRSFKTGTLQTVRNPQTIADGARTPSLGRLTFPLVRQHVADMLTVSDEDLLYTLRFLWERMKLMVEPTGALGLAAAYQRRLKVGGRRVGVIVSGGNVDRARFAELTAPHRR
jgi:threonine dehydratase